jgi:hypothetical protein
MPNADIQMADLAFAHLPVVQADEVVRGLNHRVEILGEQPVVGWLFGQCNGVLLAVSAR